MIFLGFYNAPNAPNAPNARNEVLKTTLFFTKNTLKHSSSKIIVQLQILKNLNVLKINIMRFLFVLEMGIEPALPKKLDFESSASTSSATRAFDK
tara:strand:- start:17775 stop:18059 length:285 start_codon:yes stop_codon:yes gene_type:complete